MLSIENLTYIYEAMAPFSYDLILVPRDKDQETHVLTEKNGSGKSTLMDLIAGFLKPHGGDIKWQGQSLLGRSTRQRPVSYLMQDPAFFPHLSVFETVCLSRAADHDCVEALNAFETSIALEQEMSTLSGGQRQLVLYLQALLQKREIILLDEPFSAMDAETEKQARLYLKSHQAKTGSVVLMSHHGAHHPAFLP